MRNRSKLIASVGLICLPVLLCADEPAATDGTRLLDVEYATACGPIAGYVALRQVGAEAKLADVARDCSWYPGGATAFRKVLEIVAANPAAHASAVRLSPAQLRKFLRTSRRAAILAMGVREEFGVRS